MEMMDLNKRTNIKPAAGKLLIAEPFLIDPGFSRTVVFLCEHGPDGSVGFVLNRPSDNLLGDILPEFTYPSIPVFEGGPVQNDTMHMIHRMPKEIGGLEILPGIFWGGSYTDLSHMIQKGSLHQDQFKLFIGYSGWGKGQLEEELEEGSWLVADTVDPLLFATDPDRIWKESIRSLGKDYAHLLNLPLHPQMN